MDNTAQAEGSYAAKTGEQYASNPYPEDHEFHQSWAVGWINAMQNIQIQFKVYQGAFGKALEKNRDLTSQLLQLQAEYDAFLLEQGYQ